LSGLTAIIVPNPQISHDVAINCPYKHKNPFFSTAQTILAARQRQDFLQA
jgi:hypothetical protein